MKIKSKRILLLPVISLNTGLDDEDDQAEDELLKCKRKLIESLKNITKTKKNKVKKKFTKTKKLSAKESIKSRGIMIF